MANGNAARKESDRLHAPMAQENRRGIKRPLHGKRGQSGGRCGRNGEGLADFSSPET
tara:strand:- start:185 stop:355 length:171 start_codon:yes stop_codon:yes gene_type:complete